MRRPIDPPPPREAGVSLRRMSADDVERVVEIEKDGFKHPWSGELLRRELHHDWSTALVATTPAGDGESVVAFIVFWIVHDEVHVLNVAVAAAARRRGIARRLMDEAAERGRRAGARLATLEVRRSNEAALTLYRAIGYRQVGVRPNYYADEGEDAIVMVLDL